MENKAKWPNILPFRKNDDQVAILPPNKKDREENDLMRIDLP